MAVNLLIVDDSAVMRAIILRTLRMGGISLGEIHHAGDGREALDVLAHRKIDLAIVDINMPVMNGQVLIDRIRDNPEWMKLPVIVVSTEGSVPRIRWLAEREVGFIRKPFKPAVLRNRVREIVGVQSDDERGVVPGHSSDF